MAKNPVVPLWATQILMAHYFGQWPWTAGGVPVAVWTRWATRWAFLMRHMTKGKDDGKAVED